jgi:hypothetical protein
MDLAWGTNPQYTAMRWGTRAPGFEPGDANPQWMYIWDSIDQLVAGFSTSLAFFHVHSLFKKILGVHDPTWLSYTFWWFNHCCSHSLVKKPAVTCRSCRRRSTRPPVVAVGGFYGVAWKTSSCYGLFTLFTQRFFLMGIKIRDLSNE